MLWCPQSTLRGTESFYTQLASGPKPPSQNQIEVNSTALGAGMRIVGDYALTRVALWSIRSVLAAEPYLQLSVAKGATQTWTSTYSYYAIP